MDDIDDVLFNNFLRFLYLGTGRRFFNFKPNTEERCRILEQKVSNSGVLAYPIQKFTYFDRLPTDYWDGSATLRLVSSEFYCYSRFFHVAVPAVTGWRRTATRPKTFDHSVLNVPFSKRMNYHWYQQNEKTGWKLTVYSVHDAYAAAFEMAYPWKLMVVYKPSMYPAFNDAMFGNLEDGLPDEQLFAQMLLQLQQQPQPFLLPQQPQPHQIQLPAQQPGDLQQPLLLHQQLQQAAVQPADLQQPLLLHQQLSPQQLQLAAQPQLDLQELNQLFFPHPPEQMHLTAVEDLPVFQPYEIDFLQAVFDPDHHQPQNEQHPQHNGQHQQQNDDQEMFDVGVLFDD